MSPTRFWREGLGGQAMRGAALLVGAGLLLLAGAFSVAANDLDFATWLRDFKVEARQHGISQRTLNTALDQVTPLPHVIELDHRQPEFTLTFDEYVARVVSDARVDRGRELLDEYQGLLSRVG